MECSPHLRSSKEILNVLKAFASEDRWRSWREVTFTLMPLGAFLSGAALLEWWPLRCVFSVAAGLMMVRGFIPSPVIPFYRLREAMAAVPELQHPTITRLRLRDIVGCFRANLWDSHNHRMVSYRDAAVAAAG